MVYSVLLYVPFDQVELYRSFIAQEGFHRRYETGNKENDCLEASFSFEKARDFVYLERFCRNNDISCSIK